MQKCRATADSAERMGFVAFLYIHWKKQRVCSWGGKEMGKSCNTDSRTSLSAGSLSNCTTSQRGKTGKWRAHSSRFLSQLPQSVSLIPKDQRLPSCNSQVTVMCTLLLDTVPPHGKSVDFCSAFSWSDFHSSFRHLFVKQAAVSERAEAWKFSVIAETVQVCLNYPMLSLD